MKPPGEPAARYDFRPLTEADLAVIAGWLAEPHVAQWWTGGVEASVAEIRQAMESVDTEPLMVELSGRPIAYLQSYDPHLEDDHPYQDQPFGTLGLDLSIGPPDLMNVGHGSAMLRQFVATLFDEGAPRVVIDPHPDNGRAIRAYEKAGFREIDRRTSIHGDVVLMAIDAEEDI